MTSATPLVTVTHDAAGRGRNTHGQLGIGSNEDLLDEPGDDLVVVNVGGGAVYSVAAGQSHVCARLEDASVKVGR